MTFSQYSDPDVLHYGEVPDAVPQPGEILVDVHAASVNGVAHKVRRGGGHYKAQFPHILDRDFSGVVSCLGAGVPEGTSLQYFTAALNFALTAGQNIAKPVAGGLRSVKDHTGKVTSHKINLPSPRQHPDPSSPHD